MDLDHSLPKIESRRSRLRVRVSEDGNTDGLTSILDRWQFVVLKCVYTLQPVVQPVVQPAGRNVVNIHSIKRATSSMLSTQPPCSDVISVLAGPLKRRLAGLIGWMPSACFLQPVVQLHGRRCTEARGGNCLLVV